MKILKPATHICEKCSCEYEFDKQDFLEKKTCVANNLNKGLDGTPVIFVYEHLTFVKCPICEERFIIRSEMEERR